MPAHRKRVGKRMRASKTAATEVVELSFKMEESLNEAIDSVEALHLMGHGLTHLSGEEEGRAIVAIAWTASQRLNALQETWRTLCKAAIRARDMP